MKIPELSAVFLSCMLKVWSLERPDWTCKIDEGSAGLIDVCWSPDSRHILTTADFHVRQASHYVYCIYFDTAILCATFGIVLKEDVR